MVVKREEWHKTSMYSDVVGGHTMQHAWATHLQTALEQEVEREIPMPDRYIWKVSSNE